MRDRKILVLALLAAAEMPVFGQDAAHEVFPLPSCPSVCEKRTFPTLLKFDTAGEKYAAVEHQAGARSFQQSYVQVVTTIEADGSISAASILRRFGDPAFAAQVAQSLKLWRAPPASLNGKPIGFTAILAWNKAKPPISGDARKEALSIYNAAVELLRDGKPSEAEQMLDNALADTATNFAEYGLLASELAPLKIKHDAFQEARAMTLLAIGMQDSLPDNPMFARLPATIQQSLYRSSIQAAFGLGDVAGAVISLRHLEATKGFDYTDRTVAATEKLRVEMDAQDVIATSMRIPGADQGELVTLNPYRRDFDMHVLSGTLGRYRLDCSQGMSEEAVSEGARVHVPDSWSNCSLDFTGTPGTSFQVRQYKN